MAAWGLCDNTELLGGVNDMSARDDNRGVWAGAGLVIGTGIGSSFGLIVAGGIGIALGAAFGAAIGLVAGSVVDGHLQTKGGGRNGAQT